MYLMFANSFGNLTLWYRTYILVKRKQNQELRSVSKANDRGDLVFSTLINIGTSVGSSSGSDDNQNQIPINCIEQHNSSAH